MHTMFTHASVAILFSVMLLLMMFLISKKSNLARSKNSPFECGFDPKDSSRIPFSMRFFLLAVIFLIFDIEVALLFPFILTLSVSQKKTSLIASSMFMFILMGGIVHEWNQGSLSWVK